MQNCLVCMFLYIKSKEFLFMLLMPVRVDCFMNALHVVKMQLILPVQGVTQEGKNKKYHMIE